MVVVVAVEGRELLSILFDVLVLFDEEYDEEGTTIGESVSIITSSPLSLLALALMFPEEPSSD